jgi:hypothetical protein
MDDKSPLSQIRRNFPFPWTHIAFANGLLRVNDATGKEVPIFTMIGLIEHVTIALNKPAAAEENAAP